TYTSCPLLASLVAVLFTSSTVVHQCEIRSGNVHKSICSPLGTSSQNADKKAAISLDIPMPPCQLLEKREQAFQPAPRPHLRVSVRIYVVRVDCHRLENGPHAFGEPFNEVRFFRREVAADRELGPAVRNAVLVPIALQLDASDDRVERPALRGQTQEILACRLQRHRRQYNHDGQQAVLAQHKQQSHLLARLPTPVLRRAELRQRTRTAVPAGVAHTYNAVFAGAVGRRA